MAGISCSIIHQGAELNGDVTLDSVNEAHPSASSQESDRDLPAPINYEWLENIPTHPCFTPLGNGAARSFDMGADGFTVSVNLGQEILQMTAPDPTCGIVRVRGYFENGPDAILARAQRRSSGKASFGLEFVKKEDPDSGQYEIGPLVTHGLINYRWPYIKHLLWYKTTSGYLLSSGSFTKITFVHSGTVFQVMAFQPAQTQIITESIRVDFKRKISFSCACLKPHLHMDKRVTTSCEKENGISTFGNLLYRQRLRTKVFTISDGSIKDRPGITSYSHDFRHVDSYHITIKPGKETVVVAALKLDQSGSDDDWDYNCSFLPFRSDALRNYLGLEQDSKFAIPQIWQALLQPVPEYKQQEMHAIARCAEQILTISVPVSRHIKEDSRNLHSTSTGESEHELDGTRTGIAHLHNLMVDPVVNLESTFWNVRFLIKAFNLLSRSLVFLKTSQEQIKSLLTNRISENIRGILIWVCRIDLLTDQYFTLLGKPISMKQRTEHPSSKTRSRYGSEGFYGPIIIYFILKHHGQVLRRENDPALKLLLDRFPTLLSQIQQNIDDREAHSSGETFLTWCALSCLSKSAEFLMSFGRDLPSPPSRVNSDFLRTIQIWETRMSTSLSTDATLNFDTCQTAEESRERLMTLASELDLAVPNKVKQVMTSDQSPIRRQGTVYLNSGTLLPARNPLIRTSLAPPWELFCLNYKLAPLIGLDNHESTLHSQFLSNDYLFLRTWDQSSLDFPSMWWDLECSSVICALFLDGRRTQMINTGALSPDDATYVIDRASNLYKIWQSRSKDGQHKTITTSQEGLWATEPNPQTKFFTNGKINASRPKTHQEKLVGYNWKTSRPGPPVQPDVWVQSWDDMPEIYQWNRRRDDPKGYHNLDFYFRESLGREDWSFPHHNWEALFQEEELTFLSICDMRMSRIVPYSSTFSGRMAIGKLDNGSGEEIFSTTVADEKMALWIAYIDRQKEKCSPYDWFPMMDDEALLKNIQQKTRHKLLGNLHDSLADLGVRNRILFLQKLTPLVVKSFIRLWHRESIDTFNNHIGESTKFLDRRRQTWTTNITLSSWILAEQELDGVTSFHVHRAAIKFPPDGVLRPVHMKRSLWDELSSPETSTTQSQRFVREQAHSIVLSGDMTGHWWIATVISATLPEVAMGQCFQVTEQILGQFMYQPMTGRCLIFLNFLGSICEHLADEYERLLECLGKFHGFGRQVFEQGPQSVDPTSDEAIHRLTMMVWALEALHLFRIKITDSIQQVTNAKDTMQIYIDQGPGRRKEELEIRCQYLVADFEKKFEKLSAVHVLIGQQLEQVSRNHEMISSMVDIQSTLISLKQNDNVRVLTYITIAYLPISFVATLFAAPVIPESWSSNTFAAFITVFIVVTFAVASNLGRAMKLYDHLQLKLRVKIQQGRMERRMKEEEGKVAGAVFPPGRPRQWPMLHLRRRKRDGI